MVNLFRNYQRPLMIVITVMIIIAFVLLYNGTQLDKIGVDRAYQIYGQSLKQTDIERSARRFQLAQALGLNEMIMGLAGQAYNQEQAIENFVWNSYVLTHEANRLGIYPTDTEVANRMKELPGLQTNGQFDPHKYQEFIQNVLMPNGFTSLQLEDLVRDELRLRQLILLVGTTVDATPAEYRTLYTRGHEKTHLSLVRFNLDDFTKGIEPTPEQIQKYYDEHTAALQTDEKRVISFVEIGLSEEQKKLAGRERMEALSAQSQRAEDFGQLLLKEGTTFASAAAEMGLPIVTTGEFTLATPANELTPIPEAVAAAFRLTEEARESNPLESENGVVILHLEKITPSRALTLEEAQPRIVEALRNEQGRNDLTAKANEVRTKLEAALKAGKSFDEAAAEAGATAETVPAFSLAEPPQDPAAAPITEASTELPVGGLSKVLPTQEGSVLLYVSKRDPVDEAKLLADQETQLPGLRQFKRYAVFNDWMRTQLQLANPHSLRPQQEEQQGSPDADSSDQG